MTLPYSGTATVQTNAVFSVKNNGTTFVNNDENSIGIKTEGVIGIRAEGSRFGVYAAGGIFGVEANGINAGVSGYSNAGIGVVGASTTGWGTLGRSDGGYGIFGQSATGYAGYFSGSVYSTGGYLDSSDARYKTNINPLENPLATILNLRGVSYEWKRDDFKSMNFGAGRQIGFIAQELEKVLPELVHTDSKGYKSVNYSHVVPVLVEAIKAQQAQINCLKDTEKKNVELENRVKQLETLMERLLTDKNARR